MVEKNPADVLIEEFIFKLILKVQAEVIRGTPVRTGNLRSTIEGGLKKIPGGWILGSNADYVEAVENGHPKTFIAPRKMKALHWRIGKKDFFSKGHWIPARGGVHMFQKAFNKIEKLAAEVIAKM